MPKHNRPSAENDVIYGLLQHIERLIECRLEIKEKSNEIAEALLASERDNRVLRSRNDELRNNIPVDVLLGDSLCCGINVKSAVLTARDSLTAAVKAAAGAGNDDRMASTAVINTHLNAMLNVLEHFIRTAEGLCEQEANQAK